MAEALEGKGSENLPIPPHTSNSGPQTAQATAPSTAGLVSLMHGTVRPPQSQLSLAKALDAGSAGIRQSYGGGRWRGEVEQACHPF